MIRLRHDARPLRDYQARSLEEMREFFAAGPRRRGYLSLPPGSGKTSVANAFVAEDYLCRDREVLWLAWSKTLLSQAANDLFRQYGSEEQGPAVALLPSGANLSTLGFPIEVTRADRWTSAPLVYASFQLAARDPARILPVAFRPALIVVDEAHSGLDGLLERRLFEYVDRVGASVLGLSGTPRRRPGWEFAATPTSFSDLVEEGYLARPVPVQVETGRRFPLRFEERFGQGRVLASSTLRRMALDAARNKIIVQHYRENEARYGRSIVMCGRRYQAERLHTLFSRHFDAALVHGGVQDAHSEIERFRRGQFRVAIGVRMLATGIDVPDVKTIMLASPITSDVAFLQAIARGARLSKGKTEFRIVDFVDTFDREDLAALLVRPKTYFEGSGVRGGGPLVLRRRADPRPERHEFVRPPSLVTLRYGPSDPQVLRELDGVRLNRNQTFGVELELMRNDGPFRDVRSEEWKRVANELLRTMWEFRDAPIAAAPARWKSDVDYSRWSVAPDSSCGWEVISPILRGERGFEEVALLLDHLLRSGVYERLGLRVGRDTGFHVHFGWGYGSASRVRRTIRTLRWIEPALASLLSPSRIVGPPGGPNPYCFPLRQQFDEAAVQRVRSSRAFARRFEDHRMRYVTFNFSGIRRRPQTIEARWHGGTVEPRKILVWVALLQNVFRAIDANAIPQARALRVPQELPFPQRGEDADVVALAARYLGLGGAPDMLAKLHARRSEVISSRYWRAMLGDDRVDPMLDEWDERFRKIVGDESALHTLVARRNAAHRIAVAT